MNQIFSLFHKLSGFEAFIVVGYTFFWLLLAGQLISFLIKKDVSRTWIVVFIITIVFCIVFSVLDRIMFLGKFL